VERSALYIDVGADARSQRRYELLIHVLEFIGNIEADHSFSGELICEPVIQSVAVPLLHHEDHICPAEVGGCDSNPRIVRGTGRASLNVWQLREQLFGGETSDSVAAAHEKKFRQATCFMAWRGELRREARDDSRL
jgi:hypothetical protein